MRFLSTITGYLVLLVFFIPYAFGQQPPEDGKLRYTNLTEQEMYLMRFQSICHHIAADADWDQYLTEYAERNAPPSYLAGKAGSYGNVKKAQERDLLMANYVPGQVQLAPLAPHFPLQYLYKFYPAEFMKLAPGSARQAIANEFDIRKNVPEGKRRMAADAARLPFGEERYIRGLPLKRSEYDFDNKCFYVQPDFSNIMGFLGMYAGSESVKIPLTVLEEYREFLKKVKIPYPEDKAEELFNKIDQSNSVRLWPKMVFSIIDEPVKEPVYVNYNGYNWWTLYPLKFKIEYIDIELIGGFYTTNVELVHRIKDIPEPKWEGWAISSGKMYSEGAKGPISEPLSGGQPGSVSTAASSSNAAAPASGETTATAKRNFPFMRYYKNRIKEPYVQYAGYAKNENGSLMTFGQIQLELCYTYYFEPNLHLLRQLRPSLIYGGIYLGLYGEDKHIGQALDKVEYLDGRNGFRFPVGTNPYGKNLRQVGYKNAYCEVIINDDHSVQFTFFDKNGKVQFTSDMKPLNKGAKPPFTNN